MYNKVLKINLPTCTYRAPLWQRIVKQEAVKDVFMPALSSTMTEGKVVTWLKREGESINKGESLVVIESDKADMDVESFDDGILATIVVQEGECASVGAPIAYIAESEAEVATAKEKAKASDAPSSGTTDAIGETSNTIGTVESTVSAPSPSDLNSDKTQVQRADNRLIASPYAKQLATKFRVDISTISGTGPYGRITAEDVEMSVAKDVTVKPSAKSAPAAAPKVALAPTPKTELRGTVLPFNSMQKAVANNMMESLKVPEFRVSCSISMRKLESLAKKLKASGVTMTVLLAKACGLALAKHDIINACTVPEGIQYNEQVNVAIAVAMNDGGLITPVLSNADVVDVYEMSRRWADLVKRSRSKRLEPSEYTGGTFTISNLGTFGVDCFDAILPPGTGAILAIARSKPTVVVDDHNSISIDKIMQVNLTADHRHIYGASAAEFMQTLKQIIEEPESHLFF